MLRTPPPPPPPPHTTDTTTMTNTHEYDIQMHTPFGWETVDCRETRAQAIESIREYKANQPGYLYRVIRVKATPATSAGHD